MPRRATRVPVAVRQLSDAQHCPQQAWLAMGWWHLLEFAVTDCWVLAAGAPRLQPPLPTTNSRRHQGH